MKDLTGQKYGRLTAEYCIRKHTFPNGKSQMVWQFKCECGSRVLAFAPNVTSGHTRSCGCLSNESRKTATRTHGDSGKRLWVIFRGMLQRCTDPNSTSYKNYGAKGVRVLWESYEDFKRDMGESYRDGLTIGRKDAKGHYCKDNCRWETYAQQNRNYSRNVNLTFRGKTMVKSDWASEFGIKRATLDGRLKLGWSIEKALTTPVKVLKPRRGI